MNQEEIALHEMTADELIVLRRRIDDQLAQRREALLEQAAALERVVKNGKAKRARQPPQTEEDT